MPEIFAAISCNPYENILSAALPLFEEEKVDAIEWSFDTLSRHNDIPGWFTELLQTFGNENRLIGHGVYFSLFSGAWSKEQQDWLQHLEKASGAFHFDHISEHFGFMTGEDFHHGAPISIPFTGITLAIGQDRLKRIYHAAKCPVGLENLAFSYSLEEVKKHGNFLDKLVEPVNGFIILDLHNLYCQCQNFNISFEDIIHLYPLDRVREIHISGGSWEDSQITKNKKIRRDTHDDVVPGEVFNLLELSMRLCPNLKYVVLEQLGNGLDSAEKKGLFRADFLKMAAIVKKENKRHFTTLENNFLPANDFIPGTPIENDLLTAEQAALSNILETSQSVEQAAERLKASILSGSFWEIEKWILQCLKQPLPSLKNGRTDFSKSPY